MIAVRSLARRAGTDGETLREASCAVMSDPLNVQAIREHFAFPGLGRVVTNNAASTQPPRELLALYASLASGYENVHRGQSGASRAMTALFEESYETIAQFLGAPGPANIAMYRNTTEAINAVMYSLLTEFRDGDKYRDHDDGAQLQLCPVVRDVPGDLAPARAARRVPPGALRPGHRSAGNRYRRPEARSGCHRATLAHHALKLTPPASCRLSFYLYNTLDEVDQAVAVVAAIAAGEPSALRYRK